MHVLVAPDKFKGSLTAAGAGQALAAGLTQVPGITARVLPVADGGDGTVDAFLAAGWHPVTMRLPSGRTATYARQGDTAVAELARVCGLAVQETLNPLSASTFDYGLVIGHALLHGARRIVLGLGGSASTDGGAGMMLALGARMHSRAGTRLPLGGAALAGAAGLEPAVLPPGTEFILASDVDNPLLGPLGAARVYAPQKGASASDVAILEAALANWATLVAGLTGQNMSGRPGAGAAGGTGFAALALLGARQRSGISVVLDLLGFTAALSGAGLVVTGEGRLDAQTLHGKAPIGVCVAARRAGVPVVAVAGQVALSEKDWRTAGFDSVYALSELEPDLPAALASAAELLTKTGARIGENAAAAYP